MLERPQRALTVSMNVFGAVLLERCSSSTVGEGFVVLGGCCEGLSMLGVRLFLTLLLACSIGLQR